MSISPSIEAEWVDQPAAKDPLEHDSWCRFTMCFAGRSATRIVDHQMQEERPFVHVPAFPIAQWMVQNWWSLLNEPCRREHVPGPSAPPEQFEWAKRHCLRCADSSSLLPALYLYDDGRRIRAEWYADMPDSLPHMPGEFIDPNGVAMGKEDMEKALALFVNKVLGKLGTIEDARLDETRANWDAIQRSHANADERNFCVVAGRLGLDPYDASEVNDQLAEFIEGHIQNPDMPLVRDLTEISNCQWMAHQWSWVQQHCRRLKLGTGPHLLGPENAMPPWTAAQWGYACASRLREAAGLEPDSPVDHLENVFSQGTGKQITFERGNGLPGQGVRSVVGWAGSDHTVIAGPPIMRHEAQRFHDARGLFLAAMACEQSERLVTDAYTWDQQASRAFAAEFLAPREALIRQSRGRADSQKVEDLAHAFEVSTWLIQRQLENAGADLIAE